MSYYSLEELSENRISFHYAPLSTVHSRTNVHAVPTVSTVPIIANRSVRFTEKNDTVLFLKDSSPNEIVPSHKIQVPCDTITTTDSCYQSTMQLPMYR